MAVNSEAKELLKLTPWFSGVSDSFLDALAAKMTPAEVEDGYVFVEEDTPLENLMIIDKGVLARTKKHDDHHLTTKEVNDPSEIVETVLVDEISGKGRVTGLLHAVDENTSRAYATVKSKGPAKIWIIPAADFREIIASNPNYGVDMVRVMSKVMRTGSKSLRGLIKGISQTGGNGASEHGKVCKVLCYDTASWVSEGFNPAVEVFNNENHGFTINVQFTTDRLSERSATYAAGFDVVCLFVNDNADAAVIRILSLLGVKLIAMRCAGFDRVDTKAASVHGLTVARVPAYSPYAVAEHAIALLMSVNRKIHRAVARNNMANFTLDAGLMGIDIYGKTVGVMGTGKIGRILCNIVLGFGANLLCYDVFESEEVKKAGGVYVTQDEIYARSDVIFLMMPLLPATYHTINDSVLPKLKKGVILINTSRGGLINTPTLISGLQSEIISGCGLDVFENEGKYFFQDWSAKNIDDPGLIALLGSNNVVLTAHQAFFTKEAVSAIISTTIDNIDNWEKGLTGKEHPNSV